MKKQLKLLPCPFCGSEAKLEKDELWNNSHGYYNCYDFYIRCSNDNCKIRPETKHLNNIYEKDEKIILQTIKNRWNYRSIAE